jgi:hypothetical protein
LEHEFSAAFAKNDYPLALATIEQLSPLELDLWGKDSAYYAYSVAATADVFDGMNQPGRASEYEKETRDSLRAFAKKTNRSYVTSFFAPIFAADRTKGCEPRHVWIQRYLRHRDNDPATQMEMLAFYAEELLENHPEDARSIIRAAVKQVKGGQELSETAIVKALRVCRMATLLGDYDRVETIVDSYLKSKDESQQDAAASCVILAFANDGDEDKAFESSESWLQRLTHSSDHVRAAIWRIAQSQPNSKASQRWNALLK